MQAAEMGASNAYTRFDQFRFFSYLFTGAAFLVGLGPLLPVQVFEQNQFVLLSVGVILSYLGGQALYEIAAQIQSRSGRFQSHREFLAAEIDDPEAINETIIAEFVETCEAEFESFSADDGRENLLTFFPMVVGFIQLTSRSFSLQLRSTYTFFRSMLLVNVGLAVVYTALLGFTGRIPVDLAYMTVFPRYEPFYLGMMVVLGLTLPCWWFGYRTNQHHYIEYLLADYINLKDDEGTPGGTDGG